MGKTVGIIQARGLGDIIIALPIARYLARRGEHVVWPIHSRFLPHFGDAVPYVEFLPVDESSGVNIATLYGEPRRLALEAGCQRLLVLYSYLNGTEHPALDRRHAGRVPFDEYKYLVAGVPFAEKWKLDIARNRAREQALFEAVVPSGNYYCYHYRGTDWEFEPKNATPPPGLAPVEIGERSDCLFDWLTVLERARMLVLIDSVFANLVEQMNLPAPKLFIRRSTPLFTPTLRNRWHLYG